MHTHINKTTHKHINKHMYTHARRQDTALNYESILENIRYGRPDATDAEVVAAAVAARLHDTVSSLPEGYNTVVSRGGGLRVTFMTACKEARMKERGGLWIPAPTTLHWGAGQGRRRRGARVCAHYRIP